MNDSRITVTYVTSNEFKISENRILHESGLLDSGCEIREKFDFDIREIGMKEKLEISLEKLVESEVVDAYYKLRLPCIVEHAGLIFIDHMKSEYPGGLTKPMWNSLGDKFVDETQSAGRPAIARAVVAYCDGKNVYTFVGDTEGTIAESPRGRHEFYWDTVFIPQENNEQHLTYAEIINDSNLGLNYKVLNISQSTKAIKRFLEWRLTNNPELWN